VKILDKSTATAGYIAAAACSQQTLRYVVQDFAKNLFSQCRSHVLLSAAT